MARTVFPATDHRIPESRIHEGRSRPGGGDDPGRGVPVPDCPRD